MAKLQDKLRQFLGRRQTAYRKTFNGPMADEVLADLFAFCRAQETTFHPDARVSALLEGRREVLLRILDHINLSYEDMYQLATGVRRGHELRASEPATEEDDDG